MAHWHEPPNGSDRLPLNGNKGKQVAIALFIVTSFGIMAILSFPLSRIARLPLKLRNPVTAALNPIERVIRPLIPGLGGPSRFRPPTVSVAVGPRAPRSAAPSGQGLGGPPSVPPPVPPGGGVPPTLTRPALTRTGPQPARTLAGTLVRQITAILSSPTRTLSPEQVKLIQAEISQLRSMSAACLVDRTCARQLKLVERLLHKLDARQRGRHAGKHGHPSHKHGPARGASQASSGATSHGRGRTHGNGHGHKKLEGNGVEASGHSNKRHGSHGKNKQHHLRPRTPKQ